MPRKTSRKAKSKKKDPRKDVFTFTFPDFYGRLPLFSSEKVFLKDLVDTPEQKIEKLTKRLGILEHQVDGMLDLENHTFNVRDEGDISRTEQIKRLTQRVFALEQAKSPPQPHNNLAFEDSRKGEARAIINEIHDRLGGPMGTPLDALLQRLRKLL